MGEWRDCLGVQGLAPTGGMGSEGVGRSTSTRRGWGDQSSRLLGGGRQGHLLCQGVGASAPAGRYGLADKVCPKVL